MSLQALNSKNFPDTTAPCEDHLLSKDVEPGPSLPMSGTNPRASTSSFGSERPYAPPGMFTLTLHGNCGRCRHHHRSYTVRFKALDDSNEPTAINCEHCKEKWLVFGGNNVTQISLLSSNTIELDGDDIEFRSALVKMIRSAGVGGVIGSPIALAKIPEAPANCPSRDNSQRLTTQDSGKELEKVTSRIKNQTPEAFSPTPAAKTGRSPASSNKSSSSKTILRKFKSAIRDAFPALKDVHLRDFIKTSGKVRTAAKGKGKRAAPDHLRKENCVAEKTGEKLDKTSSNEKEGSVKSTNEVRNVPKITDESANYHKDLARMEGELSKVAPVDRNNWLRERITNRKSHYIHRMCRRSSFSMVDSSTQVNCIPGQPDSTSRRHTHTGHLYTEIGSHFSAASPDFRRSYLSRLEYPYASSISTGATRASDSVTAVDTQTQSITSSSRVSLHDPSRSSSPRPASIYSPPGSRHLHDNGHRNSIDSMVAARGLGPIGGRRRERQSAGSTHTTLRSSRTTTDAGASTESIPSLQTRDVASTETRGEDDDITPTATSPPSAFSPREPVA